MGLVPAMFSFSGETALTLKRWSVVAFPLYAQLSCTHGNMLSPIIFSYGRTPYPSNPRLEGNADAQICHVDAWLSIRGGELTHAG